MYKINTNIQKKYSFEIEIIALINYCCKLITNMVGS